MSTTIAGAYVMGADAILRRRNRPDRGTPTPPPPDPDPSDPGTRVRFPSDAGHVAVSVTVDSQGAAGANTTAINNALRANDYQNGSPSPHPERPAARTVYLPEGTVWINAGLSYPGCSVRLCGAGEGRTIIRLVDNATGFQNSGSPQPVIESGWAANQENSGFANYFHHFTLNTGNSNPGAIGIQYSVANSGSMRHVTILSPDGSGRYGLVFAGTGGPGYVADTTIEGFAAGIRTEGNYVNDLVFSGITLEDCPVGIQHNTKVIAVEDLTTINCAVPVDVTNAEATLMLDGASFTKSGSTGQAVRIVANAYVYLRDLAQTGYANMVTQAGTSRFVGRASLREWGSVNYRRGNTSLAWGENSAYVGLNLPKTRAPEYLNDNISTEWACPQDFGYTSGNVGPALQAAIDSGAKVIYLPYDSYPLTTAVTVRGDVRCLDGMFSVLVRSGSGSLTVGNMTGSEVIIQNFVMDGNLTVVHNSPDKVVIRDFGNRNGHGTASVSTGASATGDLFYESAGANHHPVISRPINVYMRQINRERAAAEFSGGCSVRIFGDNVELSSEDVSAFMEISGGSTVEIIGASHDILAFNAYPTSGQSAFTVSGGSTISMVMASASRSGGSIGDWLSDTGGGAVTTANDYKAVGGSNTRAVVPMYRSP
jgi:hypothetical protein